ncbi:hypothetical protein F5146DRAFT_644106 [Armillaria mellea]|nr:hypothetical protein F5146DRAFT_644106 [Armillaria mellea]
MWARCRLLSLNLDDDLKMLSWSLTTSQKPTLMQSLCNSRSSGAYLICSCLRSSQRVNPKSKPLDPYLSTELDICPSVLAVYLLPQVVEQGGFPLGGRHCSRMDRARYEQSTLLLRIIVPSIIVSDVAYFPNCIETPEGDEFGTWFVAITEHRAIGGHNDVIRILLCRIFTKLEIFDDPVTHCLFESGWEIVKDRDDSLCHFPGYKRPAVVVQDDKNRVFPSFGKVPGYSLEE